MWPGNRVGLFWDPPPHTYILNFLLFPDPYRMIERRRKGLIITHH